MISEALELPDERVKYDKDNPSLTISRGIALLGAADAITSVLVEKLKLSIPAFITDEKLFNPLVKTLAENISNEAWNVVESTCYHWIKNGRTTDRDDLKNEVEQALIYFQNNNLNSVIDNTVQIFIKDESEKIRKEMNKIISRYSPGKEITMLGNLSIGSQQAISDSLRDMKEVINAISKSTGDIIADILWKALAAFLRGVFAIPYYIIKNVLKSDESKRRDKAKDILDKKFEIINQVNTSIRSSLVANNLFKIKVTKSLKDYFTALIDSNLQKVIIPIE